MEAAGPGSAGLWHAALFHRGVAEFETKACGFAETAVRAGAAVLVVGLGSSLDRLRTRLGGLRDRVTWADVTSIGANPGRLIHEISQFADQHSGRAIWCVQQAAWPARPAQELWEVLRHEALLNLALADAPVHVLCPYDDGLPGEMTACARATHPLIGRDGRWRPSPVYRRDPGRPFPAACDQPLPPPPAVADVLPYDDDLATVRRLVRAHARAAGLPPSRAGDLEIAIGELTANTLTHARGHGTVTLWATGGEVICQVSDDGHITDPLAGRLRPGPEAAGGGRGLWLVHQVCDLVEVRSNLAGTTIRVHLRVTS